MAPPGGEASARVSALHAGVERLLGTACVDRELCRALLRDPVGTARGFGLSEADASLLSGIRATDLPGLARALLPRLRRSLARPTPTCTEHGLPASRQPEAGATGQGRRTGRGCARPWPVVAACESGASSRMPMHDPGEAAGAAPES